MKNKSDAKKTSRPKKALYSLLSILFWVLLWQFAASLANKNLILKIPLPIETLKTFIRDLTHPDFLSAVGTSVLHIVGGFLSAVVIGTAGGVLAGSFRVFRVLSSPLLHLIRSVPVAAFIFIAWLWIPSSVLPSFIAALMVIPIIWSHVDAGLSTADIRYSEMGRVFGMSRRDIILKIRLPLIAPHLRTGCITGLGIAWKSGVASEVICNPTGSVGALLQRGKATIDYDEVFAVTLAVVLLSLLLENLLKFLWKEKS
ncbi:MAG: ABC transporter permease subunit [Clostridia bacterium]|nr:ABC transporter permease subunit [Clostridia bacterium]